jgi:hypothetical protein
MKSAYQRPFADNRSGLTVVSREGRLERRPEWVMISSQDRARFLALLCKKCRVSILTLAVGASFSVGCASENAGVPAAKMGDPPKSSEMLIVDCRLPGQVRRLNRTTTQITASQVIRTSATDCEKQGGNREDSSAASR